MAPCRSSRRCSLCLCRSYDTKLELSWAGRRRGCMAALTLSFLNSSYSGLSVGSSRRQSGQEFVCETFSVTALHHKLYLKTPAVTFPSHGKIHPEWKRCLQGISRTVSCSSNSSKHTGHLRPLSAQTQDKTEEPHPCPAWLSPLLALTCLLRRNDDHTELLNCGLCRWRRKALVPVRQVKGPRVHQVQALHQRPTDTERSVTHPEQAAPSIWWVWLTWPVLGVRSAGTVHQGWWAHSYVHQNRRPSSQKYVSVLSASTASPASMWSTQVEEKTSLYYSGTDVIIFRHGGNELAFLSQSIVCPLKFLSCSWKFVDL